MKKLIILFAIVMFALASCKKETENVSTVVKVGHPVINLIGTEVFSTPVGSGSFADPGAVAYDDLIGDSVHLSPTSNTVNLAAPGFYSVTYNYTATNGYVNYVATKSRLVLVTPVSPSQDISGTYARVSNGQSVTVTKYATGIYITDNVGGVAANEDFIFDIYFGVTSDSTIEVPVQPNPLGGFLTCKDGKLTISASDTSFSWIVLGTGFAENVRTFSHQ